MNERVKELLLESGFKIFGEKVVAADNGSSGSATICSQKFAELIVRECADVVKDFYQEDRFTCYNAAEEIKEHFGIEN